MQRDHQDYSPARQRSASENNMRKRIEKQERRYELRREYDLSKLKKFEIQIETKKINRLCVFHQQLTGAENPNVGTLLVGYIKKLKRLARRDDALTS